MTFGGRSRLDDRWPGGHGLCRRTSDRCNKAQSRQEPRKHVFSLRRDANGQVDWVPFAVTTYWEELPTA